MGNIKDKELLTFSNLTNLDWQFADLNLITEKDRAGNEYQRYSKIIEKLTPESFTREYAKLETDGEETFVRKYKKYIYGDTGRGIEESNLDINKGYEEKQRKAGIAMQYHDMSSRSSPKGILVSIWKLVVSS